MTALCWCVPAVVLWFFLLAIYRVAMAFRAAWTGTRGYDAIDGIVTDEPASPAPWSAIPRGPQLDDDMRQTVRCD